jgi:Lrp/AsnC family transcriptional regulator, leucine-responsive regulatory protein
VYLERVEEIDRQIVSLLSADGRMSFTELAKRTGLSVSAAHQRVRRLEQGGVIRGYVAICGADEIGLEQIAAIEACHSVAGDENYILKVRVASPSALEDLLQEIRTVAGVSTRTTIVLSTNYENRPPDI